MEVKSDVASRQVSFRREGNERQMRERPRAERGEDGQLGRRGSGAELGERVLCAGSSLHVICILQALSLSAPALSNQRAPALSNQWTGDRGPSAPPAGLTCVSRLLGLVPLVSPRHKQLPHRLLLAALILLCSLRAVSFGWWSTMRSAGHSQPSQL